MKNNKVIAYLTLSDIFTWGLFNVLSSLSGVYLAGKLGEDVVKIVGIGTSIYLLSNGLSQLPVGLLGDKIKDDKDEIIMMMLGSIMMGVPYLFYPIISAPIFYYVLQIIFGIGTAINVVNWRKLFAQNLQGGSEGKFYGVYGAVMGIIAAGFGLIAGYVGNLSSSLFDVVIVSIGLIMILSSIFGGLILKVSNRLSAKKVLDSSF